MKAPPPQTKKVVKFKLEHLQTGCHSSGNPTQNLLCCKQYGGLWALCNSLIFTRCFLSQLTFWVAVAKAEGTAEITASNNAGDCGTVTLTVGSASPAAQTVPAGENSASLTDCMEIRLELIRLINQIRKANGVSELPINEALMNTAQVCSAQRYTWHHAPEESRAAADAGYPYGFGDNLTVFTGTADAAQCAVNNWINSPGHFETMIDPRADCIGVGVTQYDGITYCYIFVGIPNSVNFYS